MKAQGMVKGWIGIAAGAAMLLGGAVAAPSVAAPGGGIRVVSVKAPASDDSGAQVERSAQWTVASTRAGTVLTWRPDRSLPMGDARVEFAVKGSVLGAPTSAGPDGSLSLSIPGLSGVRAKDVSAVASGRRLDAAAAPTAPTAVPEALSQPGTVLKNDPATKGKYKVTGFTYTAKAMPFSGYGAPIEVRASVVMPSKASAPGKRPVVLLLHGRHATCFKGTEVTGDWPCAAGFTSIPSYKGYAYAQRVLASQGFVTISIAANGINGQDFMDADGGAQARSDLVAHHVALLAKAGAGKVAGTLRQLTGRLNLKKLVLVGHSRGGEGVNRATIDLTGTPGVSVKGQILIAPTDFGRQVTPGVPTTVLLPYCDGDVSDLQGQSYVDQGRDTAAGDHALKSAVLVMGANHNFFNSEWTPGIAAAPADDDWYDSSDKTCGATAPTRLSSKQQRAVGTTYLTASVKSYLTSGSSAVKLLDGSRVRARSAGRAVVLTSAIGGKRRAFLTAGTVKAVTATSAAKATVCDQVGDGARPACDSTGSVVSPHWLGATSAAETPWASAVRIRWTHAGAKVTLTPTKVRSLSSMANLDLRVISADKGKPGRFDVVLKDSRGRALRLKPARQLSHLPAIQYFGSRYWAQTVRVAVPKKPKSFDLTHVTSVSLVATSAKGSVFVLDALGSRGGLLASTTRISSLPRINATRVSVSVGNEPGGVKVVPVTFTVSGAKDKTAKVWVSLMDPNGTATGRLVTIKPGVRSFSVPVTVVADGTYTSESLSSLATVTPLRNAVTGDYAGSVEVKSSVPAPKLSFPQTHIEVTQGESIRWPVELSDLTTDFVSVSGVVDVPGAGLTEASGRQVRRSWLRSIAPWVTDLDAPLSAGGIGITSSIAPFSTSGTLEIPTVGTPVLGAERHVSVVVQPDGVFLTSPVTLTAVIKPVVP